MNILYRNKLLKYKRLTVNSVYQDYNPNCGMHSSEKSGKPVIRFLLKRNGLPQPTLFYKMISEAGQEK
jgi:hypothetical protein